MNKTHDLKIWPRFFEDVVSGKKRYEVRVDDRWFRLGDLLNLREYDPKKSDYTGRTVSVIVTHITYGNEPPHLVPADVVVMGIELAKEGKRASA
jgi:hypothetical protein